MLDNDKNRSSIQLVKGRTTKCSTEGKDQKQQPLKLLVTATATNFSGGEAVDLIVEVSVGDDVQSVIKNRLEYRNPAISVVPAFMEGQGDKSSMTSMNLSPVKTPTYPSPDAIESVPENFKETITKKHQIQEVVPKRVVLCKDVQKRGIKDNIIYSGSFVITNPTDSVIAFEFSCNESANPHRFHLTPSRGLLQAHEATDVTVAVPCRHLPETLLEGSRLFVRVLPINNKIIELEELELAMLFRRNRQQDNPQGKAFKIIPMIKEETDENWMDEMRLREQNTSTCHNLKLMIDQTNSELRDFSWYTNTGATLLMTLIVIFITFGSSIPLFNYSLLSQAFR